MILCISAIECGLCSLHDINDLLIKSQLLSFYNNQKGKRLENRLFDCHHFTHHFRRFSGARLR